MVYVLTVCHDNLFGNLEPRLGVGFSCASRATFTSASSAIKRRMYIHRKKENTASDEALDLLDQTDIESFTDQSTNIDI